MSNKTGGYNTRRYYNYQFICPTMDVSGEIKYFPDPIETVTCPMCHKPKGLGHGLCDYKIIEL